eukprot:Skav203385  [mRNA]  locus=scaffold1379:411164:415169:+ [translate_table: standard]
MDPATKAEMDQLLKSSAPVNSKLEQVIKLLTSKGLAYEVVLKPEDLLCHPANRGGAMVNGFDAWAKGSSVLATGLKPSLLPPNSFCMEIDPAKREAQFQANQQMCAKAENLLGTVLGTERFLTLGTSHFVMYCRALQQGVPGPEGERVQPPPEMSALLTSGWKWVAIAAVVESTFPGFPSWCQATLNSVNSTNKVVGEFEAMLQICAYLKEGQCMDTAVDLVKAAAPACMKFGPTLLLGQDSMALLSYFDFKVEGNSLLFTRFALLSAMLTSKKHADGYQKVVFKNDFDRMSRALKQQTVQMEQVLKDAWVKVQDESIPKNLAYGKLVVRSVLLLLGKQKLGRDNVQFESMEEITTAYCNELQGKDADGEGAASSSQGPQVKDLIQATSAEVALIQHSHLKVNEQYIHQKDYADQVFTLKALTNDQCIFEHVPLFGEKIVVKAGLDELKHWKRTKKDLPQLAPEDFVAQRMVGKSGQILLGYYKAYVDYVLHEAYFANLVKGKLHFSLCPTGVYSKDKIKKGDLQLFPLGHVQVIKPEDVKKTKNLIVQYEGHSFQIVPHKSVAAFDAKDKGHFIPFFWVQETQEETLCNMQPKVVTFMDLKIPILINAGPINSMDQLLKADQQWWDDWQWSSGAWTNSDWQWQQPPWNQPPLPPPSQPPPWQGDDGEESDVPWDPEAGAAVWEGEAAAAADTAMTGLDAEPGEEPEVLGDDQPQPEPPFEGHEEGEEMVYPWDEVNLEDGMAENPASSAYPTAGDASMLGPGYAPTSGDLFTDNLEVEHVLNKMHQQPNVAPDFSQQTQVKTGWMNRCVLLVALWKERRFKHLEHVCNKFGEHYSISHNVRCLQSHIRKHGDKGPALMGYKY